MYGVWVMRCAGEKWSGCNESEKKCQQTVVKRRNMGRQVEKAVSGREYAVGSKPPKVQHARKQWPVRRPVQHTRKLVLRPHSIHNSIRLNTTVDSKPIAGRKLVTLEPHP